MIKPSRSRIVLDEGGVMPPTKRRKMNPSKQREGGASDDVMPRSKRGMMPDSRAGEKVVIFEDETSDTKIEQQKIYLHNNLRKIIWLAEAEYLLQISEWALNLTQQIEANELMRKMELTWLKWIIVLTIETEREESESSDDHELLYTQHGSKALKEFGAALQRFRRQATNSAYEHIFGHFTVSVEIICGYLIFQGMGLDKERSSAYFNERTRLWEPITSLHLGLKPISRMHTGGIEAEVDWYYHIKRRTTSENIRMDVERMWLFIDRIQLQQVLSARGVPSDTQSDS